MINRPSPVAPHKQRASAHVRRLAQDVRRTFPDMDVHEHLTDAARETDAGRHENAKRHMDAAIAAFAPLQLTRHGIHDDTGHMAAKSFMQRAHRGRLLIADAEHVANENLELNMRRKDAATAAAQDAADKRQQKQQAATPPSPGDDTPAPAEPGPAAPAGVPGKVTNIKVAGKGNVKVLSWEDIDMAIELATFAGKPPGSGANFAKLKGSLAKRGARNPGALAAYIGRKKYGAKKFASLGHATPTAGGIELVGPKGYIHGWIKASAAHLEKSGGGAYLPDHPGFGVMTPQEHRRVAAGHLHMMNQAPAGSDKARLHHKFAKLHAAASMGVKGAQRSGASYARAPRTGLFANPRGGIELVGPKGYSHGWVYHGPGGGGGATQRRFWEGKQVSETEFRQRTNASNKTLGLKPSYPEAGFPAVKAPEAPAAPLGRYHIPLSSAGKYHGKRVRGAVGGNGGVVIGTYDHNSGTIKDHRGKVHKIVSVDPSAYEASFKGDVATSHLPADVKARMAPYERGLQTGAVYKRLYREYRGPNAQAGARSVQFSAETGRLATESHPFGKPGGPGLWGVKGMELPPYIQNIARALLRTGRAKTLSQAIAMAKGATNRWQHGKNTSPEVRAASAQTNADWAGKQATAHAHANGPNDQVQWMQQYLLTGTAAGAAKDPRIAAGAAGGGRFGSGGAAAGGKPAQKSRSQRKAALLATAKNDRAKAALLYIRIAAMRAALASAGGKVSKGQKGAKTTSKASKTASSAPSAQGTAAAAAKTARATAKAGPNPLSSAMTGLPGPVMGKAAAAAKAQAGHMNKAQLTAAIKSLSVQERNLLAAAVTASSQAAKL